MSVIAKFQFTRYRQMWSLPAPSPMYVLNLLTYKNFDSYRWYGALVIPFVLAVGGRPRWVGEQFSALAGEPVCKSLLVMRYPNHKRFLAMAVNPYYALINPFRDKGVATFEASFSKRLAPDNDQHFEAAQWIVGVHYNAEPGAVADAGEKVRAAIAAVGGIHALTTQEYLGIEFIEHTAANDPHPLTYKLNSFFRFTHSPTADAACHRAIKGLQKQLGDCSIQLYRQTDPKHYIPSLRWLVTGKTALSHA